jgi:membrane protease YdiL (CAAX protease family)
MSAVFDLAARFAAPLVPQAADAVTATSPALAPSVANGAVALACGLVLGPFALRATEWVRPGRNVWFARYGFAHVLFALLGAVAAGVLVASFAPEPYDDRLALPAALLVACGFAVRAAVICEPTGWRGLGLASLGTWRDHAAALVLLAGAAPLLLGSALVWPALFEPVARIWPEAALAAHGGDVLALVLLVLVVPLLSEVFLRGFLLPLCAQNFSEKGGLFVVALLGAGLVSPSAFLTQLVLGVLAGLVRLRTQRVLPCVLLHALWVASALALGPGGGPGGIAGGGAPAEWSPF